MAQAERPLSPHVLDYKLQLTSVLSIIHRMTGVGLAAGALFLTWWLIAAATGPEAFDTAQAFFGHPLLGYPVLFGFSVCLFYHLCNGVRHLVWDAGYCFEIENVYRGGWVMLVAAVVLTVLAWVIGLGLRG